MNKKRLLIPPTTPSFYGILNPTELKQAVNEARQRGERIVMTNGCFDILHAGHVRYLVQARQLGDRLIVAVNTDASVSQLKGKNRPIYPLEQRMQVLAALRSVDWVVAFSEETPERLITEILPNVLVKGGITNPPLLLSLVPSGKQVAACRYSILFQAAQPVLPFRLFAN
jgi:rfaE bifunctional protein nucleotidyltransferase chain/domain